MTKTDVQITRAKHFTGWAIFVDRVYRGSIIENDARFHVFSYDMLRFNGATLDEVSEYVRVWYRESDKARVALAAAKRRDRRDALEAIDAKLLKYAR